MINFGKDKVTAHLDKNVISNIIQTARASLKEPSRPFTPGDTQRMLFPSSDQSRPPSAYSIKSFSKDLEPLKQRPTILDVPIQTKRKVMSENLKSMPRKPIKAIQETYEEKAVEEAPQENEVLVETKELISELERLRYDSEARKNYESDELDDLLESISNVLAELKYLENKPAWAGCEEVLKLLALTLENFEKDSTKIMKISKCLLENAISHDLLYKKQDSGLVATSIAMGAIKLLYQLSKLPENDILFIDLDIFEVMYSLLINIVSEDSFDEISLPYDFLLFLFGILKNISNSPQVAEISCKLISPLASLLPTPFIDATPHKNPKHPSLLVQITGIISHLASNESLEDFVNYQIIDKVALSIRIYPDLDIILNCLKALTKISTLPAVCKILQNYILTLFSLLENYDKPVLLSRTCYILANVLSSHKASMSLSEPYIPLVVNRIAQYLGGYELVHVDLLVKLVRLMVNLINAEDIRTAIPSGENIVKVLTEILSRYNLEEHEELILNAVACMTNILYYDQPTEEFISQHSRILALSKISSLLVGNFNEELTGESLRALSNLTRHEEICKELAGLHVIEILILFLDHSYWAIVYYALGCLINISSLSKELLYSERCFDVLIGLLEDTAMFEPQFSKQLMMIFCNLCSLSKGLVPWESVAGEENVKRLSGVVEKLRSEGEGEDLDVAQELSSFMPKALVPCEFEGCGRKFPNAELLKQHWERRHT